jgi:ABC-type antimicrobial peptide transport system permease subunit
VFDINVQEWAVMCRFDLPRKVAKGACDSGTMITTTVGPGPWAKDIVISALYHAILPNLALLAEKKDAVWFELAPWTWAEGVPLKSHQRPPHRFR